MFKLNANIFFFYSFILKAVAKGKKTAEKEQQNFLTLTNFQISV